MSPRRRRLLVAAGVLAGTLRARGREATVLPLDVDGTGDPDLVGYSAG
ncbi:hypothetical protein ACLFMI_22600 [Pseudonocardia nantongensis]